MTEFAPQFAKNFPFDCFISYSHTSRQRVIAQSLQRGLHQFAKPFWRMRAVRVFRDETNLSANPSLFDTIVEALDASKYLLLLASPLAAKSEWVAQELLHWFTRQRTERLIVVLTDGDLHWEASQGRFDPQRTTALPSETLIHFAKEPFYVDLRWAKDTVTDLTLQNLHFADAVATISARLRSVEKDEIIGEDVRLRRLTKIVAGAGVAGLAALAVGLAGATHLAVERQKEAEQTARVAVARQLAAESESMLADFPQRSLLLAAAAVKTSKPEETIEPRARVALGEALARIQGQPLLPGDSRAGDTLVSGDGTVVAIAGRTGNSSIWRLAESAPKPLEFSSKQSLRLLSLSWSGRWIVTRDQNGVVRVNRLDSKDGGETVLSPAGADINSAAFSPAENWVLTTGRARLVDDNTFSRNGRWGPEEIVALEAARGKSIGGLWDLRAAQPRGVEVPPEIIGARVHVFSPDGAWLVTVGPDPKLRVWAMRGDTPYLFHTLFRTPRDRVAFSPDSRWLFAGGGPSQASVVFLPPDASSPSVFLLPIEAKARLTLHGTEKVIPEVTAAEFSSGDRLAVGTIDGTVRIWRLVNAAAPKEPERMLTHSAPPVSMRFSPDGNWLVVKPDAVVDGPIVVEDDRRPQLHDLSAPPGGKRFILSETDAKDLRFTDDSAWLLVHGRRLDIWFLQAHSTGLSQAMLARSEPDVSTVRIIPDKTGTVLLTGHKNGNIRVHRLVSGQVPAQPITLLWHESPVTEIAPARSENWLISIAEDHTSALWHFLPGWQPFVPASSVRETIERSGEEITGVYFDSAGKKVAIRTREGPVFLGPAAMPGGALSDDLYPKIGGNYYSGTYPSAFSPDGRWLAVSGGNRLVLKEQCERENRILIRDLLEEKIIHDEDILEMVIRVAFSPDGQWLLVKLFPTNLLCPQRSAILWRMPSHRYGSRKFELIGDDYMFADGGRWLIEGTRDGAFLMDLNSPNLDRRALKGSLVQSHRIDDDRDILIWNGRWLVLKERLSGERYAVDLKSADPRDSKIELPALPDPVEQLAVSPDDEWLWALGDFERARLFRINEPSREGVSQLKMRWTATEQFLFVNRGRKLAVSGRIGSSLYDLSRSDPDGDRIPLAPVGARLKKSGDDCWLGWASEERTIAVLNTCEASSKPNILRAGGAGAENGGLAFDSSSKLLAFVGDGGTVQVWELDRTPIGPSIFIDQVDGPLKMIGFAPGNEPMLLALQGGHLIRWSFGMDQEVDKVQRIVPRKLSEEECRRYFSDSDMITKLSGGRECRY